MFSGRLLSGAEAERIGLAQRAVAASEVAAEAAALAGSIAGNLFTKVGYVGLVCGSGLLLLQWLLKRGAGWRLWALVTMLALVVIIQFGLTPMLAELRVQGLSGSARFGQLHALTGGLYLVTSMLGMALVVAGQPNKELHV